MLKFYFFIMFRVWMIILSVLSFTVLSFATLTHEARMVAAENNSSQMQHMEHASSSKAFCAEDKTCTTDAGLCDLVCIGSAVSLPLDYAYSSATTLPEKYLRKLAVDLMATAPMLNDRPPILRLL